MCVTFKSFFFFVGLLFLFSTNFVQAVCVARTQ